MKRIVFLLVLILSVSTLFAEDISWGSMYDPPCFGFDLGTAYESNGTEDFLAIYPEVEFLFWKPVIGSIAFFDLGAGLKGRFGLPFTDGAEPTAGVGLLGSVHLGFRGFDFPGSEYVDKIDFFTEAGVKYDFMPSGGGFGPVLHIGVNYFVSDNVSIGPFFSLWGDKSGGGLSVTVKTDVLSKVSDFGDDVPEVPEDIAINPYLLHFRTLYDAAGTAGGRDFASYAEGQGSVRRISSMKSSGEDSYIVEESLLGLTDDGKSLWSMRVVDNEEQVYYEYISGSSNNIVRVYYEIPGEGCVSVKNKGWPAKAQLDPWKVSGVQDLPGVSVNVEAGEFLTTEYSRIDDDGTVYKWWVSSDVPGSLVSYILQNDSEIVTCELIDVTYGNKARLYSNLQP